MDKTYNIMSNTIDIIFVVPAFKPKMKEESLGTLILAKKLLLEGYNVDIVRYWNAKNSPRLDYDVFRNEFVSLIVNKSPKIVSFYCRCEEYHICLDLANRIKELSPFIKIIFGGPQAELVAKETIRAFNFVDYICCSEGENTITPLLHWIIKEKENLNLVRQIKGLTYRTQSKEIIQNPFPEFLPDNYVRSFYYYDLIPKEVWSNTKGIALDVGRGCPFACTFCSTKTFWKRKYRLRNIPDILNEVKYVVDHYGVKVFDFKHDLFTVNKKRILQFCEGLKNIGNRIEWGCDSRIGAIDYEMIDHMVETGLTNIFFGIESGSNEMQQIINKHLNIEEADRIVKYCLRKGRKVTTSFIYGFPEETDQTISETIKLAVRFQNYGCNVLTNMCHITNGTELYSKYKDVLYFSENTSFNQCIIGLDILKPLIHNNIYMFANFCDYPNPLRQELSYLDVFRYTLNYAYKNMHEEHKILFNSNYASIYMYRIFCKLNKSILGSLIPAADGDVTTTRKLLKHDTSSELYRQMIINVVGYIHEAKKNI
jgi:radical SAM superfamily enzyme YgiQ (UPF0313 family)